MKDVIFSGNAQHREFPALVALCAWAAAILYGSWIPFDIDIAAVGAVLSGGMEAFSFKITTVEDVLTNILIYFPLGVLAVAAAKHRTSRGFVQVVWAGAFAAGVSVLSETVQVGISMRVASTVDVIFNIAGALLGAVVAVSAIEPCRRYLRISERGLRRRPFAVVASLIGFGLFCFNLVPFDFVTSTSQLHDSFLAAQWRLLPSVDAALVNPLRGYAQGMTSAAWFLALGYLEAMGRRERGLDRSASLWSAARTGILIVASIEVLQLFVRSHVFELSDIFLRGACVVAGAWCGAFVVKTLPIANGRPLRTMLPTAVLPVLAVVQSVAMLAYSYGGEASAVSSPTIASASLFPFQAMWHGSMLGAAATVTSALAAFVVFALTIALMLRRIQVRRVWPVTATLVAATALAVEAMRSRGAGVGFDATGPFLAILSVVIAAEFASMMTTRRVRPNP